MEDRGKGEDGGTEDSLCIRTSGRERGVGFKRDPVYISPDAHSYVPIRVSVCNIIIFANI